MAAKQYYVEYGKEMLPDRLLNLLPSYLPESQLQGGRVGLEKWAHLVMNCHKKVRYTNKYILTPLKVSFLFFVWPRLQNISFYVHFVSYTMCIRDVQKRTG